MEEKLLSRREAASILGVSHWTVRRWEHEGKFHPVVFSSNNVKIRLSELQAFIEASSKQ